MSVVLLADARTYLNEVSTALDAELQTFIDAAEAAIAQRIGPLTTAAQTSRVRGWGYTLQLPVWPVASLTSVTPVGGTALTVADLIVDPDSLRTVEYLQSGYFGARWYDVVYTAGRTVSATVNPDIYKADLELIRHMWSTQRGKVVGASVGATRLVPGDVGTVPGAGYTFPARITDLLNPYLPLGVG
jgi:hypothetical protein